MTAVSYRGRIGLVMFDVDGTLRDENGWKPHAEELLTAVTDSDLTVALCSGRPFESLEKVTREFPRINHIASASGALVRERRPDGWHTLESRGLAAATVTAISVRSDALGMELWGYSADRWFAPALTPRVRAERRSVGAHPSIGAFAGRTDLIKLLAFPVSRAQRTYVDGLDAHPALAVAESYPGYFDIVDARSVAMKGGDVLTSHLGLPWTAVAAMGDGENDLGMLSHAQVALCVAPLSTRRLAPLSRDQVRVECRDRSSALRALQDLGVVAAAPAWRAP